MSKIAAAIKLCPLGPTSLLVGSLLALLASFVLSYETLILARDSDAALSCNLSLALNCATVAKSEAAAIFGFPNSFLGLVTLPVMATIAVLALARVKLPRWFVRLGALGVAGGLAFAGWMLYQSLFVIQVLCPWCLLTDLGMILVAFGMFRYMATSGHWFGDAAKVRQFAKSGYDLMIAIAAAVAIIAVIIVKFGDSLLV